MTFLGKKNFAIMAVRKGNEGSSWASCIKTKDCLFSVREEADVTNSQKPMNETKGVGCLVALGNQSFLLTASHLEPVLLRNNVVINSFKNDRSLTVGCSRIQGPFAFVPAEKEADWSAMELKKIVASDCPCELFAHLISKGERVKKKLEISAVSSDHKLPCKDTDKIPLEKSFVIGSPLVHSSTSSKAVVGILGVDENKKELCFCFLSDDVLGESELLCLPLMHSSSDLHIWKTITESGNRRI